MPISPIVLQRRHAELGRIRLGNKGDRGQPQKLQSFRFTSPSERYIRDLAELYGGTPQPWDNNGVASWEVYTTANSIPVIAVKGGLSQWLEYWQGGGCVHRCDGENNVLTGEPCDHDEQVKTRVRGQDVWVNPHTEAKPTTRLSVMLPELEAIGVWRMESHGWNAAAEIPAVAELAQYVGDLVPANLHLVERRSVKDGKTSRFVVPVLDLQIGTARLKEIVAAKLGGTELTAGPAPAQAAIGAGPAQPRDFAAEIEAAEDVDQLHALWREVDAAGRLDEFRDVMIARARVLKGDTAQPAQAPAADGTADAELVDEQGDPDTVWQKVLAVAGDLGMSLSDVTGDFEQRYAMNPGSASAGELAAYLEVLRSEGRAA